MKNIQVIDGADNCAYRIFAAEDDEFADIFPGERDIEFADNVGGGSGRHVHARSSERIWKRPYKEIARGIQGTLFYQLGHKKRFYPTRREDEMTPAIKAALGTTSDEASRPRAGFQPTPRSTRLMRCHDVSRPLNPPGMRLAKTALRPDSRAAKIHRTPTVRQVNSTT